jgi:hypothetical protein
MANLQGCFLSRIGLIVAVVFCAFFQVTTAVICSRRYNAALYAYSTCDPWSAKVVIELGSIRALKFLRVTWMAY